MCTSHRHRDLAVKLALWLDPWGRDVALMTTLLTLGWALQQVRRAGLSRSLCSFTLDITPPPRPTAEADTYQ